MNILFSVYAVMCILFIVIFMLIKYFYKNEKLNTQVEPRKIQIIRKYLLVFLNLTCFIFTIMIYVIFNNDINGFLILPFEYKLLIVVFPMFLLIELILLFFCISKKIIKDIMFIEVIVFLIINAYLLITTNNLILDSLLEMKVIDWYGI